MKRMFCPNCGGRNATEQKFCRSCGMNLTVTAGSLDVQFGKVRNAKDAATERFFENLGKFGFGGFGAIVVIGIVFLILTVFTRYIASGTAITFGTFLILFLVFASLSLVYVIYNETRKDNMRNRHPAADDDEDMKEPAPPVTGKFLTDPINEPISSVVEHTTELLETRARTRQD